MSYDEMTTEYETFKGTGQYNVNLNTVDGTFYITDSTMVASVDEDGSEDEYVDNGFETRDTAIEAARELAYDDTRNAAQLACESIDFDALTISQLGRALAVDASALTIGQLSAMIEAIDLDAMTIGQLTIMLVFSRS